MCLDGGHGFLFFQRTGNGADVVAQGDKVGVGLQDGKLGSQDEQVEAFGLFIVIHQFGRQLGDVLV